LENANSIAEKALKNDRSIFNAEKELKSRDQMEQNQPNDEEQPTTNKNQDEIQTENFKIKTVFAEPEQKELKPDQHGVYSIDDYSPPK